MGILGNTFVQSLRLIYKYSTMSTLLIHFAQENIEFRVEEIKSVAQIYGYEINVPENYNLQNPFLVTSFSDISTFNKIISRCISVKSFYEVWSHAESFDQLRINLKSLPSLIEDESLNPDLSFRIKVESFNKHLTQEEKTSRIHDILSDGLIMKGRIDLSDNADLTLYLHEYYNPSDALNSPHHLYFSKWLGNGCRKTIDKYKLSQRLFIGNTSMDPILAMIISNMAHVSNNSIVFDPFVGSGSLLVACAHHGAFIIGQDINKHLLNGRGKSSRVGTKWRSKHETLLNTLNDYGLSNKYLDVLVGDFSDLNLWRRSVKFDAIVTDPPYGIRESSQCKEGGTYRLSDILSDLLMFAARHLILGGRLVYWMPVVRKEYSESNIARHNCLKAVSNSEQVLNSRCSRRLITMVKTAELQEETDGGYSVDVDHYEKATFRERYFDNRD